jgi:hypothetical protein
MFLYIVEMVMHFILYISIYISPVVFSGYYLLIQELKRKTLILNIISHQAVKPDAFIPRELKISKI